MSVSKKEFGDDLHAKLEIFEKGLAEIENRYPHIFKDKEDYISRYCFLGISHENDPLYMEDPKPHIPQKVYKECEQLYSRIFIENLDK